MTAVSFIDALISGILRPVMVAAIPRSGVPKVLPFCLFDAEDKGRCRALSRIDCVEFCRALDDTGLLPFVGIGDALATAFESGNVLRIGDEAMDGDIAKEFTVLFLFGICKQAPK